MDIKEMLEYLPGGINHQVTQWSIAFIIAAWVHAGRVKKEIKSSFAGLSEAIKNMGDALSADLKNHSQRIEKVEEGLDNISDRVKQIEGVRNA